MNEDAELGQILVELERRAVIAAAAEPVEAQIARVHAMLIAAFGQRDFDAALEGEDDE